MPDRRKHEIITFKVDETVWDAMKGIPNRSAFIRSAVMNALGNACPLCKGSGFLTEDQQQHWQAFTMDHAVAECHDCHAIHLVCPGHETPVHEKNA